MLLWGDGPCVHSLPRRIHPLASSPFVSLPFPFWQAFQGAGLARSTALEGGDTTTRGRAPMVHTGCHPCTLRGDSVRSGPQQSPMVIWELKVWLYHHAALWALCWWLGSANYTFFCPGLVNTNKFICFQRCHTGSHHSLENLRKTLKVWKPIAAAEKTICRKIVSCSNKSRRKGNGSPRLPQGTLS